MWHWAKIKKDERQVIIVLHKWIIIITKVIKAFSVAAIYSSCYNNTGDKIPPKQ